MLEFFLFLVGVLLALVVLSPLVVWALAAHNIGWTFVKEGSAKAVMIGDQFAGILMAYKGHILLETEEMVAEYNRINHNNTQLWDIVPATENFPEPTYGWLTRLTGARWYGIPPFRRIHRYHFRWTAPVHNNGTGEAVAKEEDLEEVLVKEVVYADLIKEAETIGGEEEQEMLPVDLRIRLVIQVRNPFLALFRVHRWLDATLEVIGPQVRSFVASHTYSSLNAVTDNQFTTGVITDGVGSAVGRYGVVVRELRLENVNPGSELASQYRDATTKKFVAQREGEAKAAQAEGEAKAIRAIGEARAQALGAQTGAVVTAITPAVAEVIRAIRNNNQPPAGGNGE